MRAFTAVRERLVQETLVENSADFKKLVKEVADLGVKRRVLIGGRKFRECSHGLANRSAKIFGRNESETRVRPLRTLALYAR